MQKLPRDLEKKLEQREKDGTLRSLTLADSTEIDFLSNDYLGIARASREKPLAALHYGGSGGSRLLSGNTALHQELEQYLANFYGAEAALLFPSGYMANMGLFSCLPQRGDLVLYDAFIHASIRDALRLSNAKSVAFEHNDLDDLNKKLLHLKPTGNRYILIESIYSMDGDYAKAHEINALAEKHGAYLLMDEAHGTGVVGKNKRGLFEDFDLSRLLARVHTFGKALGSHGAVVVSGGDLRRFIINFSRPFIYTTAMPKSQLIEIRQAHELFEEKAQEDKLARVLAYFHKGVDRRGLRHSIPLRHGPIQLYYSSITGLKQIVEKASNQGVLIKPIFAPTVPMGQERIRIVLHAYNTEEEIDVLLNLFGS